MKEPCHSSLASSDFSPLDVCGDFSARDVKLCLAAIEALDDDHEDHDDADSVYSTDLSVLLADPTASQRSLLTGSLVESDLDAAAAFKTSFHTLCSIQDNGYPSSCSVVSDNISNPGTEDSRESDRPAPRRRRREREGRVPRFQVNTVDFGPPPSTESPCMEQLCRHQLARLAASMKRTEASRRCVLVLRGMLFTPEQRRQIEETQRELRRRRVAALRLSRMPPPQQQQERARRTSVAILPPM